MKPAQAILPTEYGTFQIIIYQSKKDQREHAVLVKGEILNRQPVVVRIHSQCLTGDTFLSLRCDCREQLHRSMKMIQQKGQGVIIYLNQEGRDTGLTNKIKAYSLQDAGFDTVEANEQLGLPVDPRSYEEASLILKNLKISQIILMTNNPDKVHQLKKYGITVVKCIPLEIAPNQINKSYLKTKKEKLGHKLKLV